MTVFLRSDEVVDLNELLLQRSNTLRDYWLLDEAVLRAEQSAAGLMHGIACSRPFVDGNKRTALASAAAFFLANGYVLDLDADDAVRMTLQVAHAQLGIDELARALKSAARPIEVAPDLDPGTSVSS